MQVLVLSLLGFLLSGCGTRYYIVRHAEKGPTTTTSDVPLSGAGTQRAIALKETLRNKKVTRIFSTGYLRTRATAQPLSGAAGVRIETYDPADTAFAQQLKNSSGGSVLVVGHSNTVDDLVNNLTGRSVLQDLPDTQYGDLFVVTKRGKTYRYSKKHFGL